MACGIMFLHERPTAQQYAGAALMLVGVVASQVLQPAKAELAAEVTSRER
jgi:drug/metabolite transporter (DMT)-like permease